MLTRRAFGGLSTALAAEALTAGPLLAATQNDRFAAFDQNLEAALARRTDLVALASKERERAIWEDAY